MRKLCAIGSIDHENNPLGFAHVRTFVDAFFYRASDMIYQVDHMSLRKIYQVPAVPDPGSFKSSTIASANNILLEK